MKVRKRLKPYEAVTLGFEVKEIHNKYMLTNSQLEQLERLRTSGNTEFKEIKRTTNGKGEIVSKVERLSASNLIDIPENHIITGVSTNVTTGQQWVKTGIDKVKNVEEVIKEIDFDTIVAKYIDNWIIPEQDKFKNDYLDFDRLVYTDVHIGMTTNENGFSLYGGKWDEMEINKRLATIINHTIKNQKSKVLIIDELGDFMDGWDGETTRKGHKLPQNMDNEKAFDIGLRFKVSLIDSLKNHYDRIICHNICNDNHAGSFGYVVNSAFKSIAESKDSKVSVVNIRKFIDHYTIGNRCFILSHGKDSKSLKFGFKPFLDSKQIEKISGYIDHHNLHNFEIEFSKGDSHQKLFDESTSEKFSYYNYGALSPSSEWVQTNFKRGKSFFEVFNYLKDGTKTHNPFVFNWDNNRDEIKNEY
tara:strand:+ start:3361 stop:4608 length:1248 start_codon:yes stop_codon:yes gene_type:complete